MSGNDILGKQSVLHCHVILYHTHSFYSTDPTHLTLSIQSHGSWVGCPLWNPFQVPQVYPLQQAGLCIPRPSLCGGIPQSNHSAMGSLGYTSRYPGRCNSWPCYLAGPTGCGPCQSSPCRSLWSVIACRHTEQEQFLQNNI